ncbi:MAG: hypothetical protein ACRCRZ_03145 [Metamycoplasmataceae bacterium]
MEQKNEQMNDKNISVNGKNINMDPKSKMEGKKFGGNLSYEDIISQTKEIAFNVVKTEKELIEADSKERKEKMEALEEQYKNLNAKPLSSIDSYENYNLVLNKSIWNYNEIEHRNTKFSFKDLVLQTHIYLYDGVVIPFNEIEKVLNEFLNVVFNKIIGGYPVVLNPILIIDIIRFDKSKVIPVTIANPKLLPPLGVIEWNNIFKNERNNFAIVDTFIKLIDNALNNGHEVEFFPGTIMVRGVSGITSLYVSERAAVTFNKAGVAKSTSPNNK